MSKLVVILLFTLISLSEIFPKIEKVKITGFVIDVKTNERIIGSLILSDGIGVAVSDSSGYFSFKSQPGQHKIKCRYIGYEPSIKEINLEGEETVLFFYLKPIPIEIEKVTITGVRYKETKDYKTYELQSGDLSKIPVFLESDALRSVQALPGVTTVHDLSSLIYLRGGNYDETLITLDDVPVYNSYHLGGIFGSFNPDIVDREILYPSNYPVKYQGALSGVLSIYSKNGNAEKLKGIASAGLVSSKVFLEGPLMKGNFIFSARRTYPDLLLSLLSKASFPYYFYDFNGKYSIPLDDKNLLSISGFYSKDIFKLFVDEKGFVIEKKDDLNWGNKIAQITYNHFFKNGIFKSDFHYSNSIFGGDAKGISSVNDYSSIQDSLNHIEHIYVDNSIKDISLKSEVELNFPGQNINVGAEYKSLSTGYNWDIKETEILTSVNVKLVDVFFDFAPDNFNYNDYSRILSAYLSDKIQLTSSFYLMLGYRGLYIKKINKYLNSPYLLANYKLSDGLKLSVSYGRYYEYFFTKRELTRTSYASPFAIYFISNDPSKIPTSDHFSLGLKVKEILPDIRLEVEGYYKNRFNVISSDELSKTISYTNGYSAGVDVLLKEKQEK